MCMYFYVWITLTNAYTTSKKIAWIWINSCIGIAYALVKWSSIRSTEDASVAKRNVCVCVFLCASMFGTVVVICKVCWTRADNCVGVFLPDLRLVLSIYWTVDFSWVMEDTRKHPRKWRQIKWFQLLIRVISPDIVIIKRWLYSFYATFSSISIVLYKEYKSSR